MIEKNDLPAFKEKVPVDNIADGKIGFTKV